VGGGGRTVFVVFFAVPVLFGLVGWGFVGGVGFFGGGVWGLLGSPDIVWWFLDPFPSCRVVFIELLFDEIAGTPFDFPEIGPLHPLFVILSPPSDGLPFSGS